MRSVIVWFVPVLILMATPALAQEKGQVGVTMGYPAAVGIVWHAADRVALRPELTFNQSTSDITGTVTITVGNQTQTSVTQLSTTSTVVATGVSGLIYVSKRDGLSTFVSPRYTYSHLSSTPSGATTATSTTTTTHGVSGSFGAQYAMGRRFSVFGEVGLAYTSGASSLSQTESLGGVLPATTRSETKNHTVGMRAGVGVVLYFR
jgi:hypothetical protein